MKRFWDDTSDRSETTRIEREVTALRAQYKNVSERYTEVTDNQVNPYFTQKTYSIEYFKEELLQKRLQLSERLAAKESELQQLKENNPTMTMSQGVNS